MRKIYLYTSIVLMTVLITSCSGFPSHMVMQGRQNLIIYKVEKHDDPEYGSFKYAVTDATGQGWTLYSFSEFQIGDTLNITNNK